MKLTSHVPRLAEMLPEVARDPKAALRILDAARGLTEEQRGYRHWDKVRYHKPCPAGFSAREWWCALKVLRAATARPLPLMTIGGWPVHVTSPRGLSDRLRRLGDRLASPVGSKAPAIPEAAFRAGLFRESLSSSLIEGAATDRRDALQLLTAARPPRDLGERMVLNNYRALRRVAEVAPLPMTPARLREIQGVLTDGTLREGGQVGRFRTAADRIVLRKGDEVIFTPPPAEELPRRMAALCAFANGEDDGVPMDPVLRAILLHYWLAYDHPFADGNGRTARALFHWSMLRSGHAEVARFPLSSAILADLGAYHRAFRHAESDSGDATYFVLNQVDMLERALGLDEAGEGGDIPGFVEEPRDAVGPLPRGLNARQQALMESLRRDPDLVHTLQGYRELHGVTPMTAWRDLEGLRRRRLLALGRKQGKAAAYVAPGRSSGRPA